MKYCDYKLNKIMILTHYVTRKKQAHSEEHAAKFVKHKT